MFGPFVGCGGNQPLEILKGMGKRWGRGAMEEGAMEGDSGYVVIDVEGVWILDGMGMLSCIRAGIGVSVWCALVGGSGGAGGTAGVKRY